jgi:hypothetical protein
VLACSVVGLFILFRAKKIQGYLLLATRLQWACFRGAIFKLLAYLAALDQGSFRASCMRGQIAPDLLTAHQLSLTPKSQQEKIAE